MNIFVSLLLQLNWFTKDVDQPFQNLDNKNIIDRSIVKWNPIKDGASAIADGVWGIKKWNVDSFADASWSLLLTFQNALNRILWFIALIALIYLIVLWIQILFTPKDDEVKKIWTRITAAARAIWGIWFSRIIVSFIFYVIKIISNS